MQRKRTLLGVVVVVGIVSALGFSSFGGAAVHRVSQLIAPTANSAVGDVNAFATGERTTAARPAHVRGSSP